MNLIKRWREQHEKDRPPQHGNRGDGNVARRDWASSLRRDFDRLMRDPFGSLMGREESQWPAIDVAEDDKCVTIRADVPGMDAKDLDVQVSGNQLTISGKRQDEWSENKGGVQRRERVSGTFARTVSLPSYVDPEKIDARFDKGTLTVTVPRMPGQGPKKVQISG